MVYRRLVVVRQAKWRQSSHRCTGWSTSPAQAKRRDVETVRNDNRSHSAWNPLTVVLPYRPAGHNVPTVRPMVSPYRPAGVAIHAVCAVDDWYRPIGHSLRMGAFVCTATGAMHTRIYEQLTCIQKRRWQQRSGPARFHGEVRRSTIRCHPHPVSRTAIQAVCDADPAAQA